MENGNHSVANGEVKDASGDAPKLSLSSRPAPTTTPDSTSIAGLLPPELISSDGTSDSGSRRSSMAPRIPSRQLLQTALDLAQKAVEMDKGNDVAGALAAYREAVTKLRVVMERVGVDPMDPKRAGKNEDEGRTLRGIHDAYMARITLLSAYEGAEAEEAATSAAMSALLLDTTNGSAIVPGTAGAFPIPNNGSSTPTSDTGPSTPLRSPGGASSIMSARRKRRIASKQSIGLDEEADLTGVDGIDGDAETDDGTTVDTSIKLEASPRNSDESDRPLPPLPATGDRSRSGSTATEGVLLSSTTQGSISRRRQPRSMAGHSMSSISELNGSPRGSLADSIDTASTRHRAMSTMMKGFGYVNGSDVTVPPVPPLQAHYKSTLAPPIRLQGNAHLAMQPEPQPVDLIHRPFHLMRLLYTSMDPTQPGAYISSYLHVDSTMWKPQSWKANGKSRGEFRLGAQDAKARVCAALIAQLESIKSSGAPLLEGTRNARYGDEPTVRLSVAEKDQASRVAAHMASLLDSLDDELDSSHKTLQSKGVSVGGWKGKTKSSWGSRLSARVDKMSRSQDNPDRYLDLLQQLFASFQIIDDHLHCFTGQCTPAYHSLPPKTYKQIEARLTRAAQFVAMVVIPFVMDDLRQLLLAYMKGGLKYLEE